MWSRILISFFGSLFLLVGFNSSHPAQGRPKLSEPERKEMVTLLLRQALKDFQILESCSDLELKGKKVVFLSSKNLPLEYRPEIEQHYVEVQSPSEIRSEIEVNQQHCWVALGEVMEMKGKQVVSVQRRLETHICKTCIRYVLAETLFYEAIPTGKNWNFRLQQRVRMES